MYEHVEIKPSIFNNEAKKKSRIYIGGMQNEHDNMLTDECNKQLIKKYEEIINSIFHKCKSNFLNENRKMQRH